MTHDRQTVDVLAVVAEAGGAEAAAALAREAGGTEIYLPRAPAPGHWLLELLGDTAVAALLDAFGHGTLYIPMADSAAAERVRERIRELSAEGWSATRIARELGCALRTVYKWRANP